MWLYYNALDSNNGECIAGNIYSNFTIQLVHIFELAFQGQCFAFAEHNVSKQNTRLTYTYLVKPGFHMIVGDRSRSLGSLVNRSAIVTIIWKPNFYFASDLQRSQQLPMIAKIMIAGIESESISAIVVIVNDRQRSQKLNGNHQCSDCSDRNAANFFRQNPRPGDSFPVQNSGPWVEKTKQNPHPRA